MISFISSSMQKSWISKTFSQALVLPSPNTVISFIVDGSHPFWNFEIQKGAFFCCLHVATKILYQIKSDMCCFPSISSPFTLFPQLEAIDGMSTSDPVKSGIFGGRHQVPKRDLLGRIPVMGNKGQESLNQLLLFRLERNDMKNEEKFAKVWRNWWTSSCISEKEYLNINSKGDISGTINKSSHLKFSRICQVSWWIRETHGEVVERTDGSTWGGGVQKNLGSFGLFHSDMWDLHGNYW